MGGAQGEFAESHSVGTPSNSQTKEEDAEEEDLQSTQTGKLLDRGSEDLSCFERPYCLFPGDEYRLPHLVPCGINYEEALDFCLVDFDIRLKKLEYGIYKFSFEERLSTVESLLAKLLHSIEEMNGTVLQL